MFLDSWCNTCWKPQPCPCSTGTTDIDAWCATHLGSPALEAEYRRREQFAQAMLARLDREAEAWTAPAQRWCVRCHGDAPLSAGGLCVGCDLETRTRENDV